MIRFIAFYGTLRSGERNGLSPATAAWLGKRSLGPCRLFGTLWGVGPEGRYPGLVPGAGRVVAELFGLGRGREAARILRELDAYEEYLPGDRARSEYRRRVLPAMEPRPGAWRLLDGARRGRVKSFVYVYNRSFDRVMVPRIAGDDWAERGQMEKSMPLPKWPAIPAR